MHAEIRPLGSPGSSGYRPRGCGPVKEVIPESSESEKGEGDPSVPATPKVAAQPNVAGLPKLSAFIAHGKNMAIVEQVQTMLSLADIESEVAENEETAAIPVPDKVFGAMHRCNVGVIVEIGRASCRERVYI